MNAPDAPHHTMRVDTYSEEYRHQCEVRQVLRWRCESVQKVRDYFRAVEGARGADAVFRLKLDCVDQWRKGNRGEYGDWR